MLEMTPEAAPIFRLVAVVSAAIVGSGAVADLKDSLKIVERKISRSVTADSSKEKGDES